MRDRYSPPFQSTVLFLLLGLAVSNGLHLATGTQTQPPSVDVLIYPDIVLHNISARFLSVTIDARTIREKWQHLNLSSPKVINLAHGIAPVYLRIGGTPQDFLFFYENPNAETPIRGNPDLKKFNMSGAQCDELFQFARTVSWDVVFGLNMLIRKNGSWDPWNAIHLLKYISKKGYPVAGLELGNEPDVYQLILSKRPDPAVLGKDFHRLRSIMDSMPHFKNTKLLGPDVTNMCVINPSYIDFFEKYLDAVHTVLDGVTLHQYYLNGKVAKLSDFYKPSVMSVLEKELKSAHTILKKHAPGKKLWLGETSAAWNSGAPHVSNSYIAGFLWLDKLGLAAKYGVESVMRQDFYGGNYGLIDFKTLDPNPDYWLSILFKKLVGGPVLETVAKESTGHIRAYTHCTNLQKTPYLPGAVTIYLLNVFNNLVIIKLPQPLLTNQIVHIYLLQPAGTMGLHSREVALNQVTLRLTADHELPPFIPTIQKPPITIPALSFGFLIFPNANAKPCL